MKFEFIIEQTDTGMVIAKVYNEAGARVGLEFFCWPPFFQEMRFKRAHKWTEKWIANCEKYCKATHPTTGGK